MLQESDFEIIKQLSGGYLYHWTDNLYIPSILKYGLIPNYTNNTWAEHLISRSGCVYVASPYSDTALGSRTSGLCLKIDLEYLDPKKIVADEDYILTFKDYQKSEEYPKDSSKLHLVMEEDRIYWVFEGQVFSSLGQYAEYVNFSADSIDCLKYILLSRSLAYQGKISRNAISEHYFSQQELDDHQNYLQEQEAWSNTINNNTDILPIKIRRAHLNYNNSKL